MRISPMTRYRQCPIDDSELTLCQWFLFILIVFIGGSLILILIQGFLLIGSMISTGSGTAIGTVVLGEEHGILFRTYGIQIKSSNQASSYEGFCVLDKNIYNQLIGSNNDVTITYQKKLSTPSWQCDINDSSDIITSVEILQKDN